MIQIKALSPYTKIPSKGSPGSAGYDISSVEELIIPMGQRRLVDVGFSMAFEGNMYARIAPRSGLAVKGIDVGAGVIDSDYRGVVKVLLINNSQTDFQVRVGDRIAQMIFEKLADNTHFQPVEELGQTIRGSGGFGSTGTGEMNKSVFYVVRNEIYNNLQDYPHEEYKEFSSMEEAKEYITMRNFESQKQKEQRKLFHVMNDMIDSM
jgi:dUTP pyrophosphatase